jgi:anti-anti-sigma factor
MAPPESIDSSKPFCVIVEAPPAATPVVIVTGEVDLATAPILADRLAEVLDAGPETLILDLAGVSFMDSQALRVIAHARQRLGEEAQVILRRPSPLARRILSVTGMDGQFVIEP